MSRAFNRAPKTASRRANACQIQLRNYWETLINIKALKQILARCRFTVDQPRKMEKQSRERKVWEELRTCRWNNEPSWARCRNEAKQDRFVSELACCQQCVSHSPLWPRYPHWPTATDTGDEKDKNKEKQREVAKETETNAAFCITY